MPKVKLEKVTSVVALSYLVLIPAGAYYMWQKIRAMDDDLGEVWAKLEMPYQQDDATGLHKFLRGASGR